ncbi:MAG: MerR family transcriptional regulator [Melioribacteraceae bacterium]|nr:MerR family transcriptional regulator [Melioribacteraceae bacterium]
MKNRSLYPIKTVSEKTGLSTFIIRAWENRYKAISPSRTDSNRRLYCEKDIQRLQYLHEAIKQGHTISSIAGLTTVQLQELLQINSVSAEAGFQDMSSLTEFLNGCLEAVENLDNQKLESELLSASVSAPQQVVLDKLIIPLMIKIGDYWKSGRFRVTHEHLATQVVKNYLMNVVNSYRQIENAPVLVVSTPNGQKHEIGALLGAVVGASEGWKPVYLGPDLPAEEIAFAAQKLNAKAIMLNVVYPEDDPRLIEEVRKIIKCDSVNAGVILTGKGINFYSDKFTEAGAFLVNTPAELRTTLENIRK